MIKKLLLFSFSFTVILSSYGQVSKTNNTAGTVTNVPVSGAHIDRTFTYTAGEFTSTSLTEVELSLQLILGNGTPPITGPYGVHEDLNVRLVSPSGTAIDLVQDRWGYWTGNSSQLASYNSFTAVDGTVNFDDDNPNGIIAVGAGANDWITGDFAPHNALSGFDGENAAGTWTLRISDGNSQFSADDYIHFVTATLTVTSGSTLGVEDNVFRESIHLLNNPTTRKVDIKLDNNYTNINIILVNMIGQTILTQEFKNTNKISFDINDSSGVYFLNILNEKGDFTTLKIIKK